MRVEKFRECAAGEGVGVGDGEGVPPQGSSSPILTVSMRHPGAPTSLSDPKTQRNVIVCPTRFGPKLITVSM
jgi:hypothetical protein